MIVSYKVFYITCETKDSWTSVTIKLVAVFMISDVNVKLEMHGDRETHVYCVGDCERVVVRLVQYGVAHMYRMF